MKCAILSLLLLLGACGPPAPPTAEETRARDEAIATAINLSGNLCAKVTMVTPRLSSGEHQVNCNEYRDPGKAGTKNNIVIYMVDPDRGTVRLMGRA